jgi:hypothetical protein
MPREIRIAVEVEKRTEGGSPVKVSLKDADGNQVPIYLEDNLLEPRLDPVTVNSDGGMIFVAEGGSYTAQFQWTSVDEKNREFTEELLVDIPPLCPRCNERVPGLADYICEDCRFGLSTPA